MQRVINDVYKTVSEDVNKSYDLVKSVGDSVFANLLANIKKPEKLILKVRGLGSFYLRKAKLASYIESYRRFYTDPTYERTQLAIAESLETYENKQKQYQNFCERMEDYERYVAKKKDIREIRNKTQPVIKPKDDDEY